jgi:3'-5' exonuclease
MFIDVETVSTTATYDELSEQMKKLWQKKSNLVAKDNDDFASTYQNNAGIFAEFGKIVCVCLGYFTDKNLTQFRIKKFASANETELLKNVFEVFNKFYLDNTFSLAGHNIKEFDVPYICRRAMINGVDFPFFLSDLQNRKPWENPLVDTLHLWRFGDFKHYTSLELLATILGIETPKDDINGSEVGQVFWQQNDLERIAIYCAKDVLTSAQVLCKMNKVPLIEASGVTVV